MVLRKKYVSQESAIASYDWEEIASGLGHQLFYGSSVILSGGAEKFLIPQALFGIGDQADEGTTTLDLSQFNLPSTIQGTAYIDYWTNKNTTDIHTVTLKFQKVSGTTTDISSAITSGNIISSGFSHHAMKIDINQTQFKVGDKLRVEVVVSAGGGICGIPLNPIGSYPFILSVPFKIDL